MSIDIYNDAFKSLSILNENLFDTSTLGVTKLHSFIDDDFEEDDISIIDPEASTEEELSDSYVGKIIVDCNVCHSHIFKDREDIDIDESGLVNGEDVCPYCGEQEGFVIIGQIEEFKEGEDQEETPVEEDNLEMPAEEIPTAETPEEDEDEDDASKNESLKSLTKNPPLTEELSEVAGDDLASRVLAYLDKIEARGELTEDAEKFAYPDIYKKLENYLNKNSSVIVNNSSNGRNVVGGIRRFITHKMGVHLYYLSSPTTDDIVSSLQKALKVADVVLIDDFNRISNRQMAEILPIMIESTTPIVAINNGELDHSILSRFPNLTFDEVESPIRMEESMNNVRVETDENTVTVNSDENGKVTVTTEPNESPVDSGEMIAPIPDEEQSAIIDSELSADVDAPVEGEEIDLGSAEDFSDDEIDFDMDEIDEESADNLGESYLKRVYENVDSFKTTNSYIRENKIILEGVISFTSGKKSKTGFILESKSADRTGKVSFTGYNKHFTEDKNAYLFEGKIKDKRLILEKLSYRYTMNESLIRGRVYNK